MKNDFTGTTVSGWNPQPDIYTKQKHGIAHDTGH